MKTLPSALGTLCLAVGLNAGCAQIDPFQRPGMWQPEGVNNRNIAAMVQDPRDLVRGHGDHGPIWKAGAAAVDRLWRDKVKPLPGDQTQIPSGSGNAAGASPQASGGP